MSQEETVREDELCPDDVVEQNKSEKDDETSRLNRIANIISAAIFPAVFSIFVVFLINNFVFGDKYVNREKLQSEISALIDNGASLRAIKFKYDNRKAIKRDIVFALKQDVSLYYKYDVTLSHILEELRTSLYMEGKPKEETLSNIDKIIDEYTASNPYDKLEAGQRDLFENIRVKLGGDYSIVSNDINKLTDELSNKNKLVNEYLSDSQTSLVVSIVSAFIAVLLSCIQMWQTRRNRLRNFSPFSSDLVRKEYVRVDADGNRIRRVVYPDGRVRERRFQKDGTVIENESRS